MYFITIKQQQKKYENLQVESSSIFTFENSNTVTFSEGHWYLSCQRQWHLQQCGLYTQGCIEVTLAPLRCWVLALGYNFFFSFQNLSPLSQTFHGSPPSPPTPIFAYYWCTIWAVNFLGIRDSNWSQNLLCFWQLWLKSQIWLGVLKECILSHNKKRERKLKRVCPWLISTLKTQNSIL